jgi:uncharacterized protein YjbI with pentapeptide repeats
MSEQESNLPAPKRRNASHAKAEEVKQPEQLAAAVQITSPIEPPSQSSSDKLPAGNHWGEFPLPDRQTELEQRLKAWEQKRNRKGQLGAFAGFELTGADVYWLAVQVGGEVVGRSKDPVEIYEEVDLTNLNLQGAIIVGANLQGAILLGAQFQRAILVGAQLQGAFLAGAKLQEATLDSSQLQGATLAFAQFQGATLSLAHLEGADLREAQLQGANLRDARLAGANLRRANLEGADLAGAGLSDVDLREAQLDGKTQLTQVHLASNIRLADVGWNGVPLFRIDWTQVLRLGDEIAARQAKTSDGRRKNKSQRLEEFEAAGRAYRQLAVKLREQGITEVADRFTYHALLMGHKKLWWQLINVWYYELLKQTDHEKEGWKETAELASKKGLLELPIVKSIVKLELIWFRYVFETMVSVLTGFGFQMERLMGAYFLAIAGFASAYHILGKFCPPDVPWGDAFVLSITAFHGRVFSSPFMLGSPQGWVTAAEAICGLVLESLFIAMLTQRFFNR